MVPPGASFEFFEGPRYAMRIRGHEALGQAVIDETCRRFDRFEKIDEDLRIGSVDYESVPYGFVVRRYRGGRMSLQLIWNKLEEDLDREAIKLELERGRKK